MQEMAGLLGWLEATPLALAMRTSLWLYPIVEIFHIIGFTILVGAVVMFDLRLLGFSKSLPVRPLGHHLLRWSVASLGLVVPAGLLMFSAHPQDFVSNPVFLTKLTLIAAAGVNAAVFHAGAYRLAYMGNKDISTSTWAKGHAIGSLVIWIAVIACGRLLAYT